jgi:hypothetical protein
VCGKLNCVVAAQLTDPAAVFGYFSTVLLACILGALCDEALAGTKPATSATEM